MSKSDSAYARLPVFYGWVVVAVAFLTLAVAVNARTAFSLLFPPILDEFGWGRGVTAAAFSIGFIASAAFTPAIGYMTDRFGPRFVIPLGAAIVSLGFLAATKITTPTGLYATLGLMVVGGSIAMSFIGHSMFLPNWFSRKRGLAIGIAFSGVGVGSITLLPWVQHLIEADGWRVACLTLALLIALTLIPLNALLQRRRPEDLGLEPDGDGRGGDGAPRRAPLDTVVDAGWAGADWTLSTAARTGRFWWVFLGYFCALFAWYAVQVHQTKYLIEAGFDAETAAVALGLVGLFGICGQIGIGALSDRIGREWAWSLALVGYAFCYAALLALGIWPNSALVYGMVAAQGVFGYGVAALYGVIPADIFAGRRFASIFSVMTLGGNLGAGVGPWATGYLYDVTGSYAPGFALSLALSVVSLGCIWLAAPRRVRLAAGPAERRARALASRPA